MPTTAADDIHVLRKSTKLNRKFCLIQLGSVCRLSIFAPLHFSLFPYGFTCFALCFMCTQMSSFILKVYVCICINKNNRRSSYFCHNTYNLQQLIEIQQFERPQLYTKSTYFVYKLLRF